MSTRTTAGLAKDAGSTPAQVVTVTLNPALDQTVCVAPLRLGQVNRAQSLECTPGGKGVNVAACLADYGVPTLATGLLGRQGAQAFENLFAAKGVDERFVRVAGSTRLNIKLVDQMRNETTDINLASAPAQAAELAALEATLATLAAPGRWFVLAGSLPPGVEPDIYIRLTRHLHAAGAYVALDASDTALAASLAAGSRDALPDLIKPNHAELEAALGQTLTDEAALLEAAVALVRRGIDHVVISLGEQGALGVARAGTRWQVFRAQALTVPVASTVGAGDAFLAGLIASLLEARPWGECGRRASAFAAGKLARLGPHLPESAVLDALAARVELRTFELDP